MLSKLNMVVQSAVNVLAPPAPLYDDFEYHWKRLMNHYLIVSPEKRASIELTNIPFHLNSLYDILITEKENNVNKNETGACLEFLLQHDMMTLLATLGSHDDPPGMKQYVLRFTRKIIDQFYNPLLAHAAIYQPIKHLISSCNGNAHSASESDEVQFLFLLSSLLRKEIPYAPIFFNNITNESNSKQSEPESNEKEEPTNLMDALLSYINSADTLIRIKVCQAIMLLISLRENRVSDFIVTDTNLTFAITTRLINLFDEIQDSSDIDCIQEINVSWGLDALMSDFTATYPGYTQLTLFFSWFDFINQLIGESEPVISAAWCEVFKLCFVECVFTKDTLSNALALAVLTKCISMSTTPVLFTVFREWLIGDDIGAESIDVIASPQLQVLVDNCYDSDELISFHTLKLFSALIEKYDERTLQILVIKYVSQRLYFDASSNAVINSWSDVEDEREKQTGGSSVSRTLAPSNTDRIIESFQSLLPNSLKSSEATNEYDVYLKDVEHVYKQVKCACSTFIWPNEALNNETSPNTMDSSTINNARQHFYEGPFLRMIFKMLTTIHKQTYSINLELSSIVSRLCLLPHPHLHEFLLNPLYPRTPETPSLGHILHKVASSLSKKLHSIDQYKTRLISTRKYLVGSDPEIIDEHSALFESIIVLEEMCKELAAIVYVKYHCAS